MSYGDWFFVSLCFCAIALEPVNVFLYTWQLIPTLQIEERNCLINLIYKWYRQI